MTELGNILVTMTASNSDQIVSVIRNNKGDGWSIGNVFVANLIMKYYSVLSVIIQIR